MYFIQIEHVILQEILVMVSLANPKNHVNSFAAYVHIDDQDLAIN